MSENTSINKLARRILSGRPGICLLGMGSEAIFSATFAQRTTLAGLTDMAPRPGAKIVCRAGRRLMFVDDRVAPLGEKPAK